MGEYTYLIAGVALGIVFLLTSYFYQRHRVRTNAGHSWLSYLLLWPLILDLDKSKREGHALTKREWLGWGFVLLFLFAVFVFKLSQRGN